MSANSRQCGDGHEPALKEVKQQKLILSITKTKAYSWNSVLYSGRGWRIVYDAYSFFMHCLFGFSVPHLWEGIIQEHAQKGEGVREGRGEEEATERGIASSHCSIKSVGNDQD